MVIIILGGLGFASLGWRVPFKINEKNGNAVYLLRTVIEELYKKKVILPPMTTLERVVWEARQRAEEKISKLLISSLTPEQVEKRDRILSQMPESSKTYLAWLRETPESCSPDVCKRTPVTDRYQGHSSEPFTPAIQSWSEI